MRPNETTTINTNNQYADEGQVIELSIVATGAILEEDDQAVVRVNDLTRGVDCLVAIENDRYRMEDAALREYCKGGYVVYTVSMDIAGAIARVWPGIEDVSVLSAYR